MKALIFGQSGQVATELARQVPAGVEAIFLSRAEADLADPQACAAHIRAAQPDVVINAAAYTAVDRAEEEEALANVINGETPGAMAAACYDLGLPSSSEAIGHPNPPSSSEAIGHPNPPSSSEAVGHQKGIPLLHISTDYVFDGSGDTPWSEAAAPAPQNAYGRSKLKGEEAIRASGARHVILRTAWVFSAHGGNFVKTMLRLAGTRDHLTIVADQFGGPTPAAAIADALWRIAPQMIAGAAGGTYHFAGTPHTSWAGFAREIFVQAEKTVTVEDIPTSGFPTPAARPLNSRLDCSKLATDFGIKAPLWQAGLADVLKELDAS